MAYMTEGTIVRKIGVNGTPGAFLVQIEPTPEFARTIKDVKYMLIIDAAMTPPGVYMQATSSECTVLDPDIKNAILGIPATQKVKLQMRGPASTEIEGVEF